METGVGRSKTMQIALLTALALDAAMVGGTQDAVLRWTPGGIVNTNAGLIIVSPDAAANGTAFTVQTPGYWNVQFMLPGAAAQSYLCGISVGAVGASLTANPTMGTDGMRAVSGPWIAPAATNYGVMCGALIEVRKEAIDGTNNVLRTHCTNNAGAAPVGITVAGAWLRIQRVQNIG